MANIDLEKLTLLYEGKAKQVYATDNKDEYIVHYKDDVSHDISPFTLVYSKMYK